MDFIMENIATLSEITKIVSTIIIEEKMNWLNFVMICILLIVVVSIVAPIFIEALKNLIGKEVIIEKFVKLEWFCLLVSSIIALITYLVYILFFVVGKFEITPLDIVKYIVACLIFVVCCGAGCQVGYDKVIKAIIEIIKLFIKKLFKK